MTNYIIRKSIGYVLTAAAFAFGGWAWAWKQREILEFIDSVGGLGNVIVAIVGLVALVLSVFWPQRWNEWLRRLLLVVIFATLIFGGAKVFGAAFEQAPWLTVLGLIGVFVVAAVLYSTTILEHPILAWRQRLAFLRRRPQAAPAPATAP